jgi:hypothetical protein
MKKIIITIIALTFGVCAFAKDLETLTKEFTALTSKEARVDYVQDNVSDIAQAYPIWIKSGSGAKRGLFATAYWHTTALDNVSDYEAIRLSPQKLYRLRSATNPNWYEDLKNGGWKLDGQQLTNWQIFELARTARDTEIVEKIILNTPMYIFTTTGFDTATKTLLKMKDCETAKEKLIELQTMIATRNPNDARLDTLKAYLRIVREKCIDAKLK